MALSSLTPFSALDAAAEAAAAADWRSGTRLSQRAIFWDRQVWSLTHFYSADFSKSRIGVKKSAFSTNALSRIASVVFHGVLGPRRLVRHT